MAITHPQLRVVQGQATRAEVNAGLVIIPAHTQRAVTPVDGWARAIGGAATATTSIDVTDGTTVAISFEQAGLTQNTVLRAGDANTTVTNLGTTLAMGAGVSLVNVGTALATATHVDYMVAYTVDSAQA